MEELEFTFEEEEIFNTEMEQVADVTISDHKKLTNRDAENQHPISAITGLADALAGKQPTGDYLSSSLFIVNITINDDGMFSADKSVAEIVDAHNDGKQYVILFFDGAAYNPVLINDSVCGFSVLVANGPDGPNFIRSIVLFSNGEIETFDGVIPTKTSELENDSGYITGLAVTNTAAVGQTVKITAVDEDGQPTEWEAVDLPEPDEYVVLFHKTFETDVANTDEWGGESHLYSYRHFWTVDNEGNAVKADGIYVRIHVPEQTDDIVGGGELNIKVGQRAVTGWNSWIDFEPKSYIGWAPFIASTGTEVWAEQSFDLREKTLYGSKIAGKVYNGNFSGANLLEAIPFSFALGLKNVEYLIGVEIDLVSGGLPAGTEILIYARKYDANKIKNIPKWGAT